MAKFEIEMEITGFKLRVKAERQEDVPHITDQLREHMAAVLTPPGPILEATAHRTLEHNPPVEPKLEGQNGRSRSKGTRRRSSAASESSSAQPIVWRHDPAKWGTPRQTWTNAQKILWTLYVIQKETAQNEVSGPALADSFNSSFRQFGPLNKQNMPRDLGTLKKKSPAQVMDNSAVNPFTWYLTEVGVREAERLVTEARGDAPPA